uniref:Ig-like domain-containing protein n=1 Tax=Xiphophorus maculatus TaxID=8083 RepID=A0A3B5Q5E0_XIPMA
MDKCALNVMYICLQNIDLIYVLLLLFAIDWANRTDTNMCFCLPEVSCVFLRRCVLPCSFQSHGDDVIHWFHRSGAELRVHSYYDNQDQLGHQDQNFRGRTSLFQDQISRGNASLLLTGVKVQDEGIYKCYTSTVHQNRETFSILNYFSVFSAPVSTIRIYQDGNRITCSSEGIYPPPELTWSTEPPSNTTLQNRTTVHQTEEKLYDISSSLTGPDNETDWIYSCTIRTRRNQRRATASRTWRTSRFWRTSRTSRLKFNLLVCFSLTVSPKI